VTHYDSLIRFAEWDAVVIAGNERSDGKKWAQQVGSIEMLKYSQLCIILTLK